jgi:hypothetical protein
VRSHRMASKPATAATVDPVSVLQKLREMV